jgi:hypothetical protein
MKRSLLDNAKTLEERGIPLVLREKRYVECKRCTVVQDCLRYTRVWC